MGALWVAGVMAGREGWPGASPKISPYNYLYGVSDLLDHPPYPYTEPAKIGRFNRRSFKAL